jgi:hypothetical protein
MAAEGRVRGPESLREDPRAQPEDNRPEGLTHVAAEHRRAATHRKEATMARTQITAEPGVPQILITREFDAARALLFRAHIDPEARLHPARSGRGSAPCRSPCQ